MRKRLLPDIVSVNPSSYDDFVQCERRYLNRHLLGIPASDPGSPNATGLLAHDLLRLIHATGSCRDAAHVSEVLEGHSPDDDYLRQMIDRHAERCPSRDADGAAHEHTFARFHKLPPPIYMATARIDAVWVHDGLLDARDYKTGGLHYHRVADVPAAKVQAFVLAQAAQRRDLRLRLRYEYLNPDVLDDPDPWEPDTDDLVAIEEELRAAVERMRTIDDWKGVHEEGLCSHCVYRSICRDSAARGEAAWPVLTATVTSAGD